MSDVHLIVDHDRPVEHESNVSTSFLSLSSVLQIEVKSFNFQPPALLCHSPWAQAPDFECDHLTLISVFSLF